MLWKIVLVLGILGVLLGFGVSVVCAALPIVTEGRASWEEVAIPLIAGVVILLASLPVFLIGLIFVIKNRKKKLAPSAPAGVNQFGQ